MNEPKSDRDLLVEVHTTVNRMDTELFGGDGRKGKITELEEVQDQHSSQINFWRGGIAVCALLILAVGAFLVAHVMGGK
jgi:hypothetical protein